MKLYTYFRSSAAYRVRIALNLKAITHDMVPVHLVRDGGEHHQPAYRAINPQGRVPSLALDDDTILTQSPAILEYLEEVYPEPALLPSDPVQRAHVRAFAAVIGADIHPINNLSILQYLKGPLGQDQDTVTTWYRHWIEQGFAALEQQVGDGPYCFGDKPTLADLYLVPQVYNARRFGVDMSAFPKLTAIDAHCLSQEAFKAAAPEQQNDAE